MGNEHLPNVVKWMQRSQTAVLDKFQGLPGAFSDGKGQKRFVYVPGTRKDRVLLVAHADTVWDEIPIEVAFHDGILFSKLRKEEIKYTNKWGHTTTRKGVGIGADDRAGCCMVWNLRNLGHSILITSGEESGCIATKRLMNTPYWDNEINDSHSFAIEFDRRGKNDCVFYDVGTKDFAEYIKKETGYIPQSGSVTDIRHLCKKICGVNLSVGYYNEHFSEEKLVYDQWLNTLSTAKALLSKDTPKFKFESKDRFYVSYGGYSGGYGCGGYETSLYDAEWEEYKALQGWKNVGTNTAATTTSTASQMNQLANSIKCLKCNTVMTQQMWYLCHFRCSNCKHLI